MYAIIPKQNKNKSEDKINDLNRVIFCAKLVLNNR